MTSARTDWSFVVAGIMTYTDPTEELSLMLANFAYYDEGRGEGKGTANRFLVRIDDPLRGARVSENIDALFATSGVPTRTQSEQEMGQVQAASLGDVQFFTTSIIAAVFFTLLILTGNTMMESVRERTGELAVLKALGYTDAFVLGLVVAESVVLCVVASLMGLALAAVCFPLASAYSELRVLPANVVVYGVVVAGGVALVSSSIPAWRAARLSVVDALRRR
jgi:putative ABC transport system permease protein